MQNCQIYKRFFCSKLFEFSVRFSFYGHFVLFTIVTPRHTVDMQKVFASNTAKSTAWFILSGALSTLVVAITCIFIAKSRKSVWKQYLACPKPGHQKTISNRKEKITIKKKTNLQSQVDEKRRNRDRPRG